MISLTHQNIRLGHTRPFVMAGQRLCQPLAIGRWCSRKVRHLAIYVECLPKPLTRAYTISGHWHTPSHTVFVPLTNLPRSPGQTSQAHLLISTFYNLANLVHQNLKSSPSSLFGLQPSKSEFKFKNSFRLTCIYTQQWCSCYGFQVTFDSVYRPGLVGSYCVGLL